MAVHDQDPYSAGYVDQDPDETSEWVESLGALVEERGHQRGREIMLSLLKGSKDLHLRVPPAPATDSRNPTAAGPEAPSTTGSSAAPTTPAAATRSSTRATPPPVCTPVHSSRAD